MKKLNKLTGPRGGLNCAITTLRARGAVVTSQTRQYLATCPRGPIYTIVARIHRKHGIFPDYQKIARLCATGVDRLSIPAHELWARGDNHCVSFPSNYGRWNDDGHGGLIVPFGGYFSARNPGYGGSPRVTWHLRTGRYL